MDMLKTCNACQVAKPLSEFSPNGEGTVRPQCKECRKLALKAWRQQNLEKSRGGAKRWASENKAARRAIESKYRAANPEKSAAWSRRYRQANLATNAALVARRRAEKKQRTPPWADLSAIERIYQECERITKATGIVHHVDHEIPLKGKRVSGLHVENNLRVIPAVDNLRKKNKFPIEGLTLP